MSAHRGARLAQVLRQRLQLAQGPLRLLYALAVRRGGDQLEAPLLFVTIFVIDMIDFVL